MIDKGLTVRNELRSEKWIQKVTTNLKNIV
jgi:hypothetical protein